MQSEMKPADTGASERVEVTADELAFAEDFGNTWLDGSVSAKTVLAVKLAQYRARLATQPVPSADALREDWTGGRAWPDQLEAIAQYWAEWEENRAGTGTYTPEELAEDAGDFATGLADHLAALTPSREQKEVRK